MKEIYWQPAGHQIIQKPEGNRAFQTLEQSEMSLTSLVKGAAMADPDLLVERLIWKENLHTTFIPIGRVFQYDACEVYMT